MTEFCAIKNERCHLYIEQAANPNAPEKTLMMIVKEDAFEGKVSALTELNKEDAKILRDYLDAFINS